MYEYFTHMRLVHNAQTLICLIALYLIWLGWSPATELYGDLVAFGDMARKASQAVDRPSNLDDLTPDMPDHKAALHRQLRTALGPVYIVDPHSLPIELLTPFPQASSVSVPILWQELQNQRWRVPERLTVPRNVLDEMRVWLDEWHRCKSALAQQLYALPGPTRVDPSRYTTPTVRVAIFAGRRRSDVVSVTFQIAVYSPGLRRHYCRGDSRADFYDRDSELRVTREYKRFGPLYLRVQSRGLSLPVSLFDRYRYLKVNLSQIGERTLEEALAWAAEQQGATIRQRDLRFVGTRFTGEDLGIVLPFVVMTLHVYMLVMLHTLNSGDRGQFDGPIPWLVATPSTLALVSSVFTLALLPAGASGLALWRLTTRSGLVAFVWALIQVVIAVAIHAQALRASGNLRGVCGVLLARRT